MRCGRPKAVFRLLKMAKRGGDKCCYGVKINDKSSLKNKQD
jgi:hypothetical protein